MSASGSGAADLAQAQPRALQLASGVELHLVEAGSGTPLVFVHGVMGDWRSWAPQWPAFTPHFRCISYSRRYNHPNRNDMPSPDHSALVEAEDLAGLLDALALPSAAFVASSYGAFVALALALAQPARLRAIVAVEPAMMGYAAFSDSGRQAWQAFRDAVVEPANAAFRAGDDASGALRMTGGIHHGGSAALQGPALQRRLQNARAMRMLALSSNEFPLLPPAALRALPMPVLLATGADTPRVHAEVFRNVAAAMPQARCVTVAGAGHSVAADAPQAFNDLALRFLRQALPAPASGGAPGATAGPG
ncbi:MAG: alpha/beta hydrolase [Rubrivivax sp.]